MYAELGIRPSAQAVAQGYADLLSGFVIDQVDAEQADMIEAAGIKTLSTNTIMTSQAERAHLARAILTWLQKEWL